MAMSKSQRDTLSYISNQMKTMSAEMRAFTDGCPQPAKQTSEPTPLTQPAQLQINQTGAWRSALNFDAGNVPNEFWESADHLVRLSGSSAKMRVVACKKDQGGSMAVTCTQLMYWTRATGWVNT